MSHRAAGRHRSSTSRTRARTTTGAMLAACAFALAATAGSLQGTLAFWSDDASVASTAVAAGTLDLTLDGYLAGVAANGGTWTHQGFGLDLVLPGESRATSFTLRNAGTAPLKYAITGSATGALAPGLRFSVRAGATPVNGGTQAAGTRAGSCQGGDALASDAVLVAGTTTIAGSERALAPGASETICLVVGLHPDAPNSMQGATASALLTFSGRQAGAQ